MQPVSSPQSDYGSGTSPGLPMFMPDLNFEPSDEYAVPAGRYERQQYNQALFDGGNSETKIRSPQRTVPARNSAPVIDTVSGNGGVFVFVPHELETSPRSARRRGGGDRHPLRSSTRQRRNRRPSLSKRRTPTNRSSRRRPRTSLASRNRRVPAHKTGTRPRSSVPSGRTSTSANDVSSSRPRRSVTIRLRGAGRDGRKASAGRRGRRRRRPARPSGSSGAHQGVSGGVQTAPVLPAMATVQNGGDGAGFGYHTVQTSGGGAGGGAALGYHAWSPTHGTARPPSPPAQVPASAVPATLPNSPLERSTQSLQFGGTETAEASLQHSGAHSPVQWTGSTGGSVQGSPSAAGVHAVPLPHEISDDELETSVPSVPPTPSDRIPSPVNPARRARRVVVKARTPAAGGVVDRTRPGDHTGRPPTTRSPYSATGTASRHTSPFQAPLGRQRRKVRTSNVRKGQRKSPAQGSAGTRKQIVVRRTAHSKHKPRSTSEQKSAVRRRPRRAKAAGRERSTPNSTIDRESPVSRQMAPLLPTILSGGVVNVQPTTPSTQPVSQPASNASAINAPSLPQPVSRVLKSNEPPSPLPVAGEYHRSSPEPVHRDAGSAMTMGHQHGLYEQRLHVGNGDMVSQGHDTHDGVFVPRELTPDAGSSDHDHDPKRGREAAAQGDVLVLHEPSETVNRDHVPAGHIGEASTAPGNSEHVTADHINVEHTHHVNADHTAVEHSHAVDHAVESPGPTVRATDIDDNNEVDQGGSSVHVPVNLPDQLPPSPEPLRADSAADDLPPFDGTTADRAASPEYNGVTAYHGEGSFDTPGNAVHDGTELSPRVDGPVTAADSGPSQVPFTGASQLDTAPAGSPEDSTSVGAQGYSAATDADAGGDAMPGHVPEGSPGPPVEQEGERSPAVLPSNVVDVQPAPSTASDVTESVSGDAQMLSQSVDPQHSPDVSQSCVVCTTVTENGNDVPVRHFAEYLTAAQLVLWEYAGDLVSVGTDSSVTDQPANLSTRLAPFGCFPSRVLGVHLHHRHQVATPQLRKWARRAAGWNPSEKGETPTADSTGVSPSEKGETPTADGTGVSAFCDALVRQPQTMLAPLPSVFEAPRNQSQFTTRVFVGTWNLMAQAPPDSLADWLRPGTYDLYAIGTEECLNSIQKSFLFRSKKKWVSLLMAVLGDEYEVITEQTLQAIHLVVFVRRVLAPFVWDVGRGSVGTGLANYMGNKGGVAVSFRLGLSSFVFTNAHFAAHQKKVENRDRDYHNIQQKMRLKPVGFQVTVRDEKESHESVVIPSEDRLVPPMQSPLHRQAPPRLESDLFLFDKYKSHRSAGKAERKASSERTGEPAAESSDRRGRMARSRSARHSDTVRSRSQSVATGSKRRRRSSRIRESASRDQLVERRRDSEAKDAGDEPVREALYVCALSPNEVFANRVVQKASDGGKLLGNANLLVTADTLRAMQSAWLEFDRIAQGMSTMKERAVTLRREREFITTTRGHMLRFSKEAGPLVPMSTSDPEDQRDSPLFSAHSPASAHFTFDRGDTMSAWDMLCSPRSPYLSSPVLSEENTSGGGPHSVFTSSVPSARLTAAAQRAAALCQLSLHASDDACLEGQLRVLAARHVCRRVARMLIALRGFGAKSVTVSSQGDNKPADERFYDEMTKMWFRRQASESKTGSTGGVTAHEAQRILTGGSVSSAFSCDAWLSHVSTVSACAQKYDLALYWYFFYLFLYCLRIHMGVSGDVGGVNAACTCETGPNNDCRFHRASLRADARLLNGALLVSQASSLAMYAFVVSSVGDFQRHCEEAAADAGDVKLDATVPNDEDLEESLLSVESDDRGEQTALMHSGHSITSPDTKEVASPQRNESNDDVAHIPTEYYTAGYDYVFWSGDLNYRVNANRKMADALLQRNDLYVLLANDQLGQTLAARSAFDGFSEALVAFPPTYKFDPGTDTYDTSKKQRIPSWTDRVLFIDRHNQMLCCSYDSTRTVRTSDHRPVFAGFLVRVHAPVGVCRLMNGPVRHSNGALGDVEQSMAVYREHDFYTNVLRFLRQQVDGQVLSAGSVHCRSGVAGDGVTASARPPRSPTDTSPARNIDCPHAGDAPAWPFQGEDESKAGDAPAWPFQGEDESKAGEGLCGGWCQSRVADFVWRQFVVGNGWVSGDAEEPVVCLCTYVPHLSCGCVCNNGCKFHRPLSSDGTPSRPVSCADLSKTCGLRGYVHDSHGYRSMFRSGWMRSAGLYGRFLEVFDSCDGTLFAKQTVSRPQLAEHGKLGDKFAVPSVLDRVCQPLLHDWWASSGVVQLRARSQQLSAWAHFVFNE